MQPASAKVSRNAPCPCGSGKKYKRCCGSVAAAAPVGANPSPQAAFRRQMDQGYELERQGRLEEALALFREAAGLPGASAEARYAEACALDRLGRLDQAIDAYRAVVEAEPGFPDALFNLAVALGKTGRPQEAVPFYRRVIALQPDSVDALTNLGLLLAGLGEAEEGIACLRRAAAAAPAFLPVLEELAGVLEGCGRHEEVVEVYQSALRWAPADPALLQKLGVALVCAGRPWDALEPLTESLKRQRRFHPFADRSAHEYTKTTRAKLEHDLEQLRYLAAIGAAEPAATQWIGVLEEALRELPWPATKTGAVDLPVPWVERLAPFYNRLVHYRECPALPGGALNPALPAAAVEDDYFRNAPGITHVDGLLKAEALEALRRFCLESTIWFDFAYNNGYVGAMMKDGFLCPLLLQIAEELARAMPRIFKHHRLLQTWAYKYDSELSGIDMHADFAAVNVNFWITPDEANLDPNSGGLVVWDKEAPLDWNFEEYNRQPERMRRFLEESAARAVTVPYRQNRAVIFNSDLFHKTDDIRFRPGYENRRINVTMLFGRREQA